MPFYRECTVDMKFWLLINAGAHPDRFDGKLTVFSHDDNAPSDWITLKMQQKKIFEIG